MEYILLLLCSLCSINTYYLLNKGENTVSDTLQIIIALLTVISTLTGVIITIHKNTKETNKKIDDLNIGKFKDRTLCNYLYNSIGKGNDDKTLTGQHKDLEKLLQKEIEIIEQRYSNENKLLTDFTYQQHNIYKTIEDFNLFMQDWKRLVQENNELKGTVISLSHQLENSNNKIIELESQLANQQKNHKHQKNDFSI